MKKTVFLSILLGFCLVFLSCQKQQKADLVINNGKIFTVSEKNPQVQALAVLGEHILAVGTDKEIKKFIGPETKVLDVQGKLVIPGLIESHCHFSGGGMRLAMLNLNRARSIPELQEMLAAKINELPEGTPVFGIGPIPSPELFGGFGWPTKEVLDKVSPKNPVVIGRGGGHAYWVNSLALKLSGITRSTKPPVGGEIIKDPKTGEPTGYLKEAAQDLVKIDMPSTPREDIERALQYTANMAITGITTHSNLKEIEIFRELNREGKLTLRVYATLPIDGVDDYIAKGIKRGDGDNMLRIGLLKGFIDGTLGVRSALMFEPFTEEPGNTGLAQYGEEEFYALIEKADKNNYQIGIHAIGDKGVNWVLNGIERAQKINGKKELRHRVEHNTVNILEDTKRFAPLGVIASMQPTITGNQASFEQRLGKERAMRVDMWRTLLDNGAMLCFGTDWPVSDINPMRNINALVTRLPEQRLTMAEAIKYYTYGSAYASFEEDIKGKLEVGMLADIVVLSQDLFTIDPEEIIKTEVDCKILGGKIIYQKD